MLEYGFNVVLSVMTDDFVLNFWLLCVLLILKQLSQSSQLLNRGFVLDD